MSADSGTATVTCYRHPNREAPLGCSRCARPICLEDAIDAPVGYLCPECAQQPTRVQRAQRAVRRSGDPVVTKVLLGLLAAAFLVDGTVGLVNDGVLFGPAVRAGEWWRVLTGGFLHADLIHIGFNGYLLWILGQMLEPNLGRGRFLAIYLAGLFGGSAGALILTWNAPTLGASGAVFGLMGAAMVAMHRQGVNPFRSSIGTLVLLNLAFTFFVPGISIGGHVGGLIGGSLATLPVVFLDRSASSARTAGAWAVSGLLAAAAVFVGAAGPLL